ncbi:MAG: hypothetical protein NTV87_17945 [Ignavibacteriae bacterium]|nr:hypothetical protein [Ignavibacteriota bacterium]
MNEKLKYILGLIIYAVCFLLLSYALARISSCKKVGDIGNTIIIHDTTVVTRYEREVKRDTVVKWYERITSRKPEPEYIYVQKTDSVFSEKFKSYDFMLKVDKAGDMLIIKALNEKDSLIKEYIWSEVGRDFILTSQHKNISLKTQKLYWTGVTSRFALRGDIRTLKDINECDYTAGLNTGISYMDKLTLTLGAEYSLKNKSAYLNLELNCRLFR